VVLCYTGITNYLVNHIDTEIIEANKGKWHLTGYYGFPIGGGRRNVWNFLRCILGDFNDILSPQEKKGNNDRANWLINGF
jgi:hypothetical protein